jgi:serine/threonine protein phosphatase PrpC
MGDRIELDAGVAAAVSDRGLVHHRNEDSFFLEVISVGTREADADGQGQSRGDTVIAVVCDGVSSASAGNAAARSAAEAAGLALKAALSQPGADPRVATSRAIDEARCAVERVPWTTRTQRVDPSCTLVSAVCRPGEIVIGWAGDSRAYWLGADGMRQLTVDDSFAAESVSQGVLTPEQAARSPFLHSITHWVGPDAPERPPRLVTVRPEGPGRVLLCTDGLWNYAPTTRALQELIGDELPASASPSALAHALADAALARGGHDNVTLAVVDIER